MTRPLDHHLRDFQGYGGKPPEIDWGGGARLAVVFVVNYEEGGEYSVLDGDGFSEATLSDAGQSMTPRGTRDLAAESMFEFGGRVGVWRLLSAFDAAEIPVTLSASALALERNPLLCTYIRTSRHAVQSHGYRWINQFEMEPQAEREQIAMAMASLNGPWGRRPLGWMCRYGPSLNTRALLQEAGFSYDSDSYADEVPFWAGGTPRPYLVIPHTFANNDNKFAKGWFSGPEDWASWHRAALDQLVREDAACAVLTVSLHCRVSGQAARAHAVARFIEHVASHDGVICLTRDQLYQCWSQQHPWAP